jgi:hypothetical protein
LESRAGGSTARRVSNLSFSPGKRETARARKLGSQGRPRLWIICGFDEDKLASELAALGYPGLSHLKSGGKKTNPAELLLSALGNDNLDSRLVEALPWVVLKFPDLNWRWLTQAAKAQDLQNRLGYVTNVARRLAELRGEREKARLLAAEELTLERSRLAREDTLCHESLTEAEKRWLRKNRPPEARHWRLLTDLSPEQLDHAA